MPLVPKQTVRTNIYGTELWSQDKTGAYVPVTNIGGYGSPNPTLAHSALVAISKHISDVDTWLTAISPQVVHNPAAVDTDVNVFGFGYFTDGHYSTTLFRLRVSADGGATDLDAVAILNGDYYAVGTTVYKKTAGVGVIVPVANYKDMLNESSISKVTCEVMFFNKLFIKKRDYYKRYKDLRPLSFEDSREWLAKHDDLRADIEGTDYSFRSGLIVDAEESVKQLLTLHELV